MRRYTRNFDAASGAKKIREDFYAKPSDKKKIFSWDWPTELVEVGECLGTLYRSDKWNKKGDFIDYKHRSEAEQRLFVVPGAPLEELRALGMPLVGNRERIPSGFLPDTFAELANFMGFQARLYQKDGSRFYLPDDDTDDGIYEFTVNHAMLGAFRLENGKAGLVVYHKRSGPYCFVFGVELDVEKDGIVG